MSDTSPQFSYEAMLDLVETHGVKAWRPVDCPENDSPTGSRYFGSPWVNEGFTWPYTVEGQALSFIMQFNIGELPEPMRHAAGNDGLLLLFYDLANPSWDGDGAKFYRVDLRQPGHIENPPPTKITTPAPRPFKWGAEETDFPELFALEDHLDDSGRTKLRQLDAAYPGTRDPEYGHEDAVALIQAEVEEVWGSPCTRETAERSMFLRKLSGDRLGGYPNWVQKPSWPTVSDRPMTLLFEWDDSDPARQGTDFEMFGFDGAIAQIFIDPLDPNNIEFTWDTF